MKKHIKKYGVLLMSGVLLGSSILGGAKVVKAENVGGITAVASLTDGRTSQTTKATLKIQNGPAVDLTVEARIYYRFGTRGYYCTSGVKTMCATSFSKSVSTKHTPATVDMCLGNYSVTYCNSSWSPTKTIGKCKNDVTYNLK